jgi:hypothetical protein
MSSWSPRTSSATCLAELGLALLLVACRPPGVGDTDDAGRPDCAGELPCAHPAGGLVFEPTEVALYAADPAAQIRYTTDGSRPEEGAALYSGPITVAESTRIRAQLVHDGATGPLWSSAWLVVDPDLEGFDSNLPIVVMESFGHAIDAESGSESDRQSWPRREVYTVFFDVPEGGRAALAASPDHVGRCGVKVRGNSSQILPKKQYGLELWDEDDDDRDLSLLGMPAESDWVLHAPYSDKTLMRNHLAYSWTRAMGMPAMRSRPIELIFDQDDGLVSWEDYRGVYVFIEKIKRGSDRVDVANLEPEHDAEPEISGGYIIKHDIPDDDEERWRSSAGRGGFIHVDPDDEAITTAQHDWLLGYLDDFELALFEEPDQDWRAWADQDSFIHYHLFTEALKNADSSYASRYWHKDREGKLVAGPIWDWNVSMGATSDWGCYEPTGFHYTEVSHFWYAQLLEDPDFEAAWLARWWALREGLLATDVLLADIDATAALLAEAQARNFERWPVLGEYIDELPHVNWPGWEDRDSYEAEVDWMKVWLEARLDWLDAELAAGGLPSDRDDLD